MTALRVTASTNGSLYTRMTADNIYSRSCLLVQACTRYTREASLRAMASSATLRARLVAAGQLLDGLGGDDQLATARIQTTAILAHLKQMKEPLGAEAASELSEVALAVNFGACRTIVLDAISAATESARAVDGRRPQQDYIAFLSYMTAVMWEALLDIAVAAVSKREMIATFLVTLGCVNPSEPTLKLANSFWMLIAVGIDTCRTTAADQKGRWLDEFKETFRRAKAQRDQPPSVFIKKLPTMVDEFRARYPNMHSTVFSEGEPVPSRLSSAHLSEIQTSYGCRNNGKFAAGKFAAASSSVVPHGTVDGTSGGGLASMMQTMMMLMHQQAQQQQQPRHSERDIELTFGRRGSTGPERAVRGIADLAPRSEIPVAPRATFRRAITFDESLDRPSLESPVQPSAETTLALRARAQRIQNTPPTPVPIGDGPPLGEDVWQQAPPLQLHVGASQTAADGTLGTGKPLASSLRLLNAACENAAKKESAAKEAAKEAKANKKKQGADDKNDGASQGQSIDAMPKPKRLRIRGKTPPPPMPKDGEKNASEGVVQPGGDAAPRLAAPAIYSIAGRKNIHVNGANGDGVRKCSFAVEWSRQHILCRTGEKGPGGSFALSYGVGKQYPNVETAKKAADEWLKEERKRAALEVT